MESYLLHWPTDQKWHISTARVEGQGKAVVLEIASLSDSSEQVEMVSILGGLDRSAEEIVEGQVEQARISSPDLSYHILQQSKKEAPHSWLSFSIEGIQEEGSHYSTVSHVVIGKQGTYLLIMRKEEVQLSPETKVKWATFFQSGRIVAQSLRQTLAESQLIGGDLPQIHAASDENEPILQEPKQASFLSKYAHIQALAHPEHPNDIPVWVYASGHEPFPLVQIWGTLLGEHQGLLQGLVIKASPHVPELSEQDVIYLQWSESRQHVYQIIPRYLLEMEDWTLIPCQSCGFEGMMRPMDKLIHEGALRREIPCPFCGGKQELMHKSYVPESLTPPPTASIQNRTWWQQLWQWLRPGA